jgi:hypothetical protein
MSVNLNPATIIGQTAEINMARRLNDTVSNASVVLVKMIVVIVVIAHPMAKYDRIAVKSVVNPAVSRMFIIIGMTVIKFFGIFRVAFVPTGILVPIAPIVVSIFPTLPFTVCFAIFIPVAVIVPAVLGRCFE